ncbi:SAM domain [Aureococcus anophagefferens]|uniref:SAM domain n=1 Tax=Aureococcus anophagefferens TaxID=44056 RepID=A0ABR1G975_AURAN
MEASAAPPPAPARPPGPAAPPPAPARPPRRPQVLKGCLALAGAAALGGLAAYAVATSRHPSDAAGVGDGATSDAEASLFFDSLDSDADGQIERDELESYAGARHRAATRARQRRGDRRRRRVDLRERGRGRGRPAQRDGHARLLEGPGEFVIRGARSPRGVEHAVQLPRDIADKFVDAGVSGYDFAELARDVSERGALKTEVGVRDARQRDATLRRAMRMRSRAGDPPASPAPLSILGGAKCTSAHLAWTAADGGGFPTHKCALERPRAAEGMAWEVVGDGYFHEFRDERLRPGVGYDYRVAAWNAIGRGPLRDGVGRPSAREACDPLEYLGAMALAPLFSLLRSAVFLGQLLLSGIVLFLAALRLADAGAGDADYHPCSALWTLCRVVTDYVPFARDLLLLVDPALGRVEVPELRERRAPGESDHALGHAARDAAAGDVGARAARVVAEPAEPEPAAHAVPKTQSFSSLDASSPTTPTATAPPEKFDRSQPVAPKSVGRNKNSSSS